MIYLRSFRVPSPRVEDAYFARFVSSPEKLRATAGIKGQLNVGASIYPFRLFYDRQMPTFTFEPITIFYGGNGSGKSTLLNLIAEKLCLQRTAIYNRSEYFGDYCKLCHEDVEKIPPGSRIITSDDVFDYLLNIRSLNDGVVYDRAGLYEEYLAEKASSRAGVAVRMSSLADYEDLKRRVEVNRMTMSGYVQKKSAVELRERSNGESAFRYFTEKMGEDCLCLLDEPENSMAPGLQLELRKFLEESARFFRCQLIIATHSPFLLSLKGAKIYDLDDPAPGIKPWTELANVRAYHDFFKEHENEFR